MNTQEKYRIKEFVVTVDRSNYLVVVDRHSEDSGAKELELMPNWIFESRYAIWLTAGDAPIRIRAMEGEQIKQNLIKELSLI